ncbi:hypothetical protein GCM10010309_80480 [Streptomyces violaceochromogenes]|nr:hypothetical protein GCM10010309_80480 [Streptomyces violaceochromogenes]
MGERGVAGGSGTGVQGDPSGWRMVRCQGGVGVGRTRRGPNTKKRDGQCPTVVTCKWTDRSRVRCRDFADGT